MRHRTGLRGARLLLALLACLTLPARVALGQPATAGEPGASGPPAPPPAYDAAAPPAQPTRAEREHIAALLAEHQQLSLQPRSLTPGWIVGGVGLATFIAGTAVFVAAYDADTGELNPTGDRAGLVLMPIGALVTIAGLAVVAARVRRRNRMARIEQYLEHGGVSLEAGAGPRGGLALAVRTRLAF